MSRTSVEPADQTATRTSLVRPLALIASFVAVAETAVVFLGESPAQHRWLSVVLTVVVLRAALGARMDPLRRVAWLGLLSGSVVVTRATIRFDVDLSGWMAVLDASAMLGMAIVVVLTLIHLSRALKLPTALLTGIAGAAMLLCFGLVIERSPGARLGVSATTTYKGPFPHRTFGRWYPPHSRVRGFFAANPRKYYDPPAGLTRQWRLNIHTARDLAELRFDPAAPTTLRAEILHSEPGEQWAIQLNQGPIVVHAGRPYELKFSARADGDRDFGVAISEWHPPWEGLGFSSTVHAGTEWTPWAETFTLEHDDTNARLHFDIGNSPASLELSDITLTDTTTGAGVFPDPTPYSLTHQFNRYGCRGDSAASNPSADVRRLLVLGDAYALGLGVRDADLLAARVARTLELASPSSVRIEAMTCAVPGWGARQERLFYESLRRDYRPHLVIVVSSWNDGRLEQDDPAPPDDLTIGTHLERVAPELSRLAERVRADGAGLAVVLFRNTPAVVWQRTLDALAPLEAAHVPVLDVWPAFVDQGSWETLADGPTRVPNEVAHGIAADAIAAFLRSRGLAP